jgi:hypothetical protein
MGAARDHENPDERHGYVPKLILAGRLTGTLNGRPVVIEAGESGLLLSMPSVRSAWAARRTVQPLLPALQMLKRLHVPLRLRIAGIVSVELLPNTSTLAKLFAPAFSRLG